MSTQCLHVIDKASITRRGPEASSAARTNGPIGVALGGPCVDLGSDVAARGSGMCSLLWFHGIPGVVDLEVLDAVLPHGPAEPGGGA